MKSTEHKLVFDYKAGPAVFYRCIKCKSKAFHLNNLWKLVKNNGNYKDAKFAKEVEDSDELRLKLEQTYEYMKEEKAQSKWWNPSTYFNKNDVENMMTMMTCNCNEVAIKEVIE